MKPGLWDCIREAFSARPIGMFVPPNWVGLGIFAFLGLLNPGFWVIGAGLELGYLGFLATNERFQRLVAASRQWETRQRWQTRVDDLVRLLSAEGQQRYRALEVRCRAILEQQAHLGLVTTGLDAQGEGLGRLLWVYLRLQLTRQAIEKIVREADSNRDDAGRLEERIGNLQSRLKDDSLGEELRKSLSGQIEILQQRLEKRREAKQKLAFLDAELTRIQEQVELVREQAVLSTDSETVSQRIDQITTTLGGTTQWITEQQKIYGAVEDLMAEPPSLSVTASGKQSQ
jgi:chromosome segregation ATPase